MKKFNVLFYNFNSRKIESYDVLPYFRNEWKRCKKKDYDDNEIKTVTQLKKWIISKSQYQYWGRCEYEFLIAPWPYREDKLKEELIKIDVHEQLIMNIDLIVNIFKEEFKIK